MVHESVGKTNEPRRVLIAAGGTGGHIAPALAVGDALRAEFGSRVHVRYLTGSKGIEKQAFSAANEFPDTIACDGAPKLSLAGLPQLVRYAASLRESFAFLRKYRPHVVLATGGYVCAPVLTAAKWLKIPYFLHESNAVPGRVTRMFAKEAQTVFVAHDRATARLSGNRCRNIGTPVRQAILECSRSEAFKHFGFSMNRPTLLIIGGSQGAHSVNEAMADAMPLLAERFPNGLQVVWACGPLNYKTVAAKVGDDKFPNVTIRLFDFLDRMDFAYSCCDLVVSRAGASSIAEIVALGLPSILVPYPYAKDNHQHENAATLHEAGAAELLEEKELTGRRAAEVIASLLQSPERRARMAEAAGHVGAPDCSHLIARILMNESQERVSAEMPLPIAEEKLTA